MTTGKVKSIEKTPKVPESSSPSRAFARQPDVGLSAAGFDATSIPQMAGNLAVQQLFRAGGIQGKLKISQPGDPDEEEADRVADQVMRMTEPAPIGSAPSAIQRKCAACEAGGTTCPKCEEEAKLQRKEKPGHVPQVAPAVHSQIATLRGGGQSLPPSSRAFFEPRFERDFSGVRVHADGQAAQSARAIQARAFTAGQEVVFGAGEYAPESPEGKRLLAHELTHVIQQAPGLQTKVGLDEPRARSAPGVARETATLQRWTNPLVSLKSNRELLDAALNEGDTAALKQVTDFSSINLNQTLQLIDLLNGEESVWGRDARAMRLLWSSIGASFEVVASKEGGARWKISLAKVSSLSDEVPEAKAIKDQFPKDVKDIVSTILEGNRLLVLSEIKGLGLAVDASTAAAPLSGEQRDKVLDMQGAALRLARLQKSQELARQVNVGWRAEQTRGSFPVAATGTEGLGNNPIPEINAQIWYPVQFDPYRPPPFLQAPSSQLPYIIVPNVTITPYDEVKEKFEIVSTFIELTLSQYPALFGVARDKESAATNAFGTASSPEVARDMLGRGLRKVIEDIERTRLSLGDKLDLLDLTPVHAKMMTQGLRGSESPVAWDHPAPAAIAHQLVKDHDFNRALEVLALETAAAALFLLSPLAGPGALFVMLAGMGVQGAQAIMSAERFEAMATAARSQVKPGSDIVSSAAVDDAEKEKKADLAALELTGMLLVAGEAVARLGTAMPASPLDNAARAEAIRVLDVAKAEEPSVTLALEEAAGKVGGKLEGKAHMFKTEESLARKLRDRAAQLPTGTIDPVKAVAEVSGGVNDALRYTISVEPKNYLTMKQQVSEILLSKGYKLAWEWNAWGDPKTPYRGMNSTWRTQKGQLFEVQFHTPQSYEVKSLPAVRAMYEEARAAGTSPERRAELIKLMYEKYDVVMVPPGVEVNKP